ncbi:unnamed protein product [Spirodela intermedia]|uniref:Uncharacterized protein n=1 Tax=Spirodela intermedia TaxID=51605 RepID=A0A7I8KZI3_SPIIN|nr:unnamed protein product [Spirodela intermedia]
MSALLYFSCRMEADEIVSSIKNQLPVSLHQVAGLPGPSIFKVRSDLKKENLGVFDPKVISIGPYHHGKPSLAPMETVKRRLVKQLLDRCVAGILERCVTTVLGAEVLVRAEYAAKISQERQEFVELMVIDSFFLIEFMWLYHLGRIEHLACELSSVNCSIYLVVNDLVLIENQIPFSVLNRLRLAIMNHHRDRLFDPLPSLIQLGSCILKMAGLEVDTEIFHLLDLSHSSYKHVHNISDFRHLGFSENIPCARELQEAGVRLKKRGFVGHYTKNLLRASFKNGTLEIPTFSVDESTHSIFKNLVVYEQCRRDKESPFTSYALFLSNIVTTEEDVAILRQHGILRSKLGSDQEVAHIFSTILKGVRLNYDRHHYVELFADVNKFCQSVLPRWRAALVKDYFNNPWTSISVLTAILVLVFSGLQTIYTVLDHYGG